MIQYSVTNLPVGFGSIFLSVTLEDVLLWKCWTQHSGKVLCDFAAIMWILSLLNVGEVCHLKKWCVQSSVYFRTSHPGHHGLPNKSACVLSCYSHADPLWPHWLQPTRFLWSWDSPGKNTGVSCSPPEDLLDPVIEPASFMSPALAGGFFDTSTTWEALTGPQKLLKGNMNFFCESACFWEFSS